jgi:predicted metal-dependent enzyme (double-stranded beta helix superfamily)
MTTFSVEDFARGCKEAMARTHDKKAAARACMHEALASHGAGAIIRALAEAVPPGATIGELIVYASPELTLLYGRMPPRFQSGIHNHTVCAVIAQLEGEEVNRIYEKSDEGALREVKKVTLRAGEVLELDRDVIHAIENPGNEPAHALHFYKGDFRAISDRRSLWSWDDHEQKTFSFPELLKESALAMHRSSNHEGLRALVKAIPASKAFVDGLVR